MRNAAKNKLRNWICQTASLVMPSRPFNIHIDELLDQKNSRSEMIDACGELFAYAIECFGDRGNHLVLILMIPLSDADSMDTVVPSLTDITRQQHSTPPSIYLIHREALSRPERTERYQIPTSFDWIPANDDRYFVCYKTWRELDAPPEDGWVREIFVEYNAPNVAP